VPQVTAATRFFTVMTALMIVSAAAMAVTEWKTPERWVPLVVLGSVLVATELTRRFIFPYNDAMAAGIRDAAALEAALEKWMALNRVRVSLWTVQWLCMAFWFAGRALEAREAAPGRVEAAA